MTEIICLTLGDFGVNTYLFAYKKGICIVDPGDKADIIEKSVISLQEKSNLPKDCEISIFLTHGHLDHVGAIEKLKSIFTNAKIKILKISVLRYKIKVICVILQPRIKYR